MSLYPWQEHVLDGMLGETDDGKWAAFEACLIVPRQNGKTFLLLARVLAGLLLFGERLILWTSQLDSTNLESFRELERVLESNDFLNLRIQATRRTNGQVTVELKGGQRVRFVCRSSNSGRGFTADCVIFDEAYKLEDAAMAALSPTLLNRPNPQIWYTSSAPLADSKHLWSVRRRGLTGDRAGRLAFMEWSVDPDDYDPEAPESLAVANPTLGFGNVTLEGFDKLRDANTPAVFVREFCGIPDPEPAEAGDLALSAEAWNACFDGRSSITGRPSVGLDVGLKGYASIAVAGPRADGLTHVEIPHREETGDWLVALCAGICERNKAQLVIDPSSGAGAFLPDLIAAKVPVVTLTRREVVSACGRFTNLVNEGKIRHLGTGVLNAAVSTAVRAKRGEAFVFAEHSPASPDLSPLYAATLAAWPQDAPKVFFSY